jgi:NAD(P)-dependent dehydrogenase (short-subunit alcohol dehydrogenase family)
MRHILITGANRGIGLELAKQYMAMGDKVFACSRSLNNATDLERLVERSPDLIEILQLDVTDQLSINKSREIVEKSVSSLDLLINNAAINVSGGSIQTFQAEEAMNLFQVNTIGPILVSKSFLALLKQSDQPKVVNISSEAGSISNMNRFRGYYYYASKAALNMYTRAMALDPELKGALVAAVHPGWVKTDMGGSYAPLSPEESVRGVIRIIDSLRAEDSGGFFTWQGESLPW